ncbi:gamma-butyrobetaine dioxygenase-like [Ylistrum balloti]|uniref:gamma-butyrobetaine dioxygenase-like n=1 Tax=Ylistrum balloti TaxID=509963 RepID=UPI002905811A|nr:gamma-butyrobetaine dioxygenase-like [Ylistrum balloti]
MAMKVSCGRGIVVTSKDCCAQVLYRYGSAFNSPIRLQTCATKVSHKVIYRSINMTRASSFFESKLSGWKVTKSSYVATRNTGTMNSPVGLSLGEAVCLQPKISHSKNGQEVILKWLGGRELRFHAVWLRYNCQCPECVQPYSGQRLLEAGEVNPDITVESAYVSEDGTELHLKWAGSYHEGHVRLDFLRKNSYHGHKETVSRHQVTQMPSISYEEVMSGKRGLLRWLQHINKDGMCLVKGAPTDLNSLIKVVQRIGPVQETIYGKLFGVESTPNPINVAYSSVKLDYHMDLVYYESPPGLQFLHCIRFDDCVVGGENFMLNVMAVAELFRQQHPADFEILTKVPATFQKVHFARSEPVLMKYQRPHINLNHRGEIVNVIWSPQFEGPLFAEYDDVLPYYQAYHKFSKAIQNSQNCVKLRLKPGEILTFNNRTILHARTSFELNGGERKLQGCYLNIDEYKSKLAVLAHLLEDNQPVKHVGNQCWF